MSQNNQMKTKTSMNYCMDDFLKYSKHRLIENKNAKFVNDKTNSFTNSINYNDKETKTGITLDEDKDKLILQLNKRISELEARIQFLEAKVNRNKEAITPTPKSVKFLTISNSSQALQRNFKLKLFKETLNKEINCSPGVMQNKDFNGNKMGLILKLRSHTKDKINEKDYNNRNYISRKSPGDSYQISSINTNTNTNTENNSSIGKSIEQKRHLTIQNSKDQNNLFSKETGLLTREHSLKSLKGFKIKQYESNGNKSTPCSVYNIKTIPKIPKKNILISKSIHTPTNIKEQLSNIKQRIQNILGQYIESKHSTLLNPVIINNNNEIGSILDFKNVNKEQLLRRSLSEIKINAQ